MTETWSWGVPLWRLGVLIALTVALFLGNREHSTPSRRVEVAGVQFVGELLPGGHLDQAQCQRFGVVRGRHGDGGADGERAVRGGPPSCSTL